MTLEIIARGGKAYIRPGGQGLLRASTPSAPGIRKREKNLLVWLLESDANRSTSGVPKRLEISMKMEGRSCHLPWSTVDLLRQSTCEFAVPEM